MILSPLAALIDAPDKVAHYGSTFLNKFLMRDENARHEMGPDIFGMVKDAPAGVEFRLSRVRFPAK